ncbi:DUF3817 domain-containing protein [Actinomadura verrucosospora]|uniref:Integral membrane protein n=1 Tax=Actinomadura verrucosospora TaxID=46165 RepID=A0A7D3W0I3_ACTVE|nr:DUF3817 domain-containing protein [Actinomadura verrucosospora]QKG25434.1 integral membrane protein [Actinomadura verrucosospora]
MDIVRAFRVVSIAEATSFLILLLIAMPLKYGADLPVAVKVMGPIHGILFIGYVGLAFIVGEKLGWGLKRTVLALAAAVLPVAPYFVERHWAKPVGAAGAEPQPAGRA